VATSQLLVFNRLRRTSLKVADDPDCGRRGRPGERNLDVYRESLRDMMLAPPAAPGAAGRECEIDYK
jgi:hypothetical protein